MTSAARFGGARLVATCLGLGRIPSGAPGTVGSAFGLGLFVLWLADAGIAAQLAAAAIATLVGAVAASEVERHLGREDPQEVVIDELAGVWIALVSAQGWPSWVLAFVLFRVFDVWKPFPARQAERLPGGWGIMMDDVVAGIYALVVMQGARAAGWLP